MRQMVTTAITSTHLVHNENNRTTSHQESAVVNGKIRNWSDSIWKSLGMSIKEHNHIWLCGEGVSGTTGKCVKF